MSNATRDPDNSYDDDVIAVLELKVRRNGSMSVAGCIDNMPYSLAMLENAKDTIKNHHARRRIQGGKTEIIPARDTGLILPSGVSRT